VRYSANATKKNGNKKKHRFPSFLTVRLGLLSCEKKRMDALFSQLFLSLSRARLGKMIVLCINGAKSGVFRTVHRDIGG
jgi:hypothetical protein